MSVIWKFPLAGIGRNVVQMPKGARVIHLAAQHEQPTLWAIVDERAQFEDRTFIARMTGSLPFADTDKYIGTYFLDNGHFVGHVFEVNA